VGIRLRFLHLFASIYIKKKVFVENYRIWYTLLQRFLLQNAVIQRRVLQGGKLSLVIPWKSYLVNSELYLAISQAFIPREREREAGAHSLHS
jgi:hypothetical protein